MASSSTLLPVSESIMNNAEFESRWASMLDEKPVDKDKNKIYNIVGK